MIPVIVYSWSNLETMIVRFLCSEIFNDLHVQTTILHVHTDYIRTIFFFTNIVKGDYFNPNTRTP